MVEMSASDKIQKAKNCFKDIKESGRNNYQKFSYLETKDIFPIIRTICDKFKLKTQFDRDMWNDKPVMKLTITDQEDNTSEKFIVNIPEINTNDPGKYMQDVGRVQTYAMRYLYIQAFEIAVPDEIDNKDQTKIGKKVNGKVGILSSQVNVGADVNDVSSSSPVSESGEVSIPEVNATLDKVYDTIVVKGGKEFTEAAALWQLQRICKNKPLLFEGCKKSLKMYTADKLVEV